MQLTIKYFGMLAEITQRKEEDILFESDTISDLLDSLCIKYPKLKGRSFQIAQNNELVTKETKLQSSEIALLPPFAGG